MAGYKLTARAADDIDGIYEYTIASFGLEQARKYIGELHTQLGMIATHPNAGRDADDLAPGLRRFEYQQHIVFYLPGQHGIHVVRVLHHSMDARRHL